VTPVAAHAQVLLLSTGVIGRRIKLDALLGSVPKLAGGLGAGAEDAHHAAVAVTTTDLVSKSAALEVRHPRTGSLFVRNSMRAARRPPRRAPTW